MYTHHTAVLYTESFHEFRQVWCDDLVNGGNNEELQIGLIIVCYGSWLSNQQAQQEAKEKDRATRLERKVIYGDKKHRTREQKIKTTEDHHQATFRPQALSGQGGEGDADHNGQVLIFTIFSIFRYVFCPWLWSQLLCWSC